MTNPQLTFQRSYTDTDKYQNKVLCVRPLLYFKVTLKLLIECPGEKWATTKEVALTVEKIVRKDYFVVKC